MNQGKQILEERIANIGEKLEKEARRIVENSDEETPTSNIDREIALVLDHIQRLRELEERQRRSLLRVECYTDTELMQMEARTPTYSPYRFPEREKLQRRLMAIENERRRLAGTHEDELRKLHEKLLILLNRRSYADILRENGH